MGSKYKNIEAPRDCLWVCCACGKTSYDKYGFKKLSWGWDASCAVNCVLVKKSHLVYSGGDEKTTRVVKIEEGGVVEMKD